jgi:hypothetical protein
MEQIYDELGGEDFMDYLETVCTKAIKQLNNKHDFEPTVFNMSGILVYSNGFHERFTFSHSRANRVIEIAYTVSGREGDSRIKGLVVTTKKISALTQEIIELYTDTGAKIARKKI